MENERIDQETMEKGNIETENTQNNKDGIDSGQSSTPSADNGEGKKKEFKFSPKVGVAVVAVAATVLGGIFYYTNTPQYRYNRALETGYRYLTQTDYEQARLFFEEAIAIEPRSYDAMVGLMNVAQATDDGELLTDTFAELLATAETDGTLWESRSGEITQMALASKPYYEDSQEYYDILTRVQAKSQSEELEQTMVALLMEKTDGQWLDSQYEEALETLRKAYELNPENEEILAQLERLVADYVTECKNHQRYDKALELIAMLEEARGETVLDELKVSVEEARETDAGVQMMLEQLNADFDAQEIDSIRETMLSDSWKEGTGEINRIFYSSSLHSQDTIEGTGTAIYNVNGYLYVYYGSFQNGMRQGEGEWYYAGEDGTLVKYTLNWEKDLPNGRGICDQYGKTSTVGRGGRLLYETDTHFVDEFECVNGIFHGRYIRNAVEGKYYQLSYVYDNGYTTPLSDSEVPDEIKYYLSPEEKIIAYGEQRNGSNVWRTYSPSRYHVAGVITAPASYQVEEIELTF